MVVYGGYKGSTGSRVEVLLVQVQGIRVPQERKGQNLAEFMFCELFCK